MEVECQSVVARETVGPAAPCGARSRAAKHAIGTAHQQHRLAATRRRPARVDSAHSASVRNTITMELARKLVLYYLKMLDALSVEPQTCSPRRYR